MLGSQLLFLRNSLHNSKKEKLNLSTFDLSSIDRYYEIPEVAYMENNQQGMDAHQINVGHQQLAIITQLLQMSVNMRHIDEMFLWLSHSIGQRLNVDVLQLWSYQAHTT